MLKNFDFYSTAIESHTNLKITVCGNKNVMLCSCLKMPKGNFNSASKSAT